MVSSATMTKDNSPREYVALMARTTTPDEHVSRDKRLQLTEISTQNTANANGISANLQANPTIANRFIVLQNSTIRAQVTSGTGIVFITQGDITYSLEAAGTYVRYGYDHPRLLFGNLGYTEVQLWHQPVALPESPWISTEVIQEEERETIRADTDRALSFYELLSVLDKISRPMEVEDVPLSVDPDDYPVV